MQDCKKDDGAVRVVASTSHEHLLLPGSTLIQVDRKAEPLPLGWRIPIALIRLGSGLRIPMIWIDPSIAQPPSRNEG